MNKRNLIFLIVGLIALLVFQAKVVVPFIYDVASSDFFLVDSGDEANRISSNNKMTDEAYSQCNNYIANEILADSTINFSENYINAFSLGNFRYVVNADIEIQPSDSAAITSRYVCRIQYSYEDEADIMDASNWSVDGISGLDDSNIL